MVGVYKITNLITNECYIGQSIHVEERWSEHFCKGYGARHSKKFQDAIDKYGKAGFKFEIIEPCSPEELAVKEDEWIAALKPEYNARFKGRTVDEAMRKRISLSLKGRKQDPALVEKRRQAILERHKTIPQTNAGHRKRVAVSGEITAEFESVKATAEFFNVHPSTVTQALKRSGKVKGHKVRYVV